MNPNRRLILALPALIAAKPALATADLLRGTGDLGVIIERAAGSVLRPA